MVKFDGENWVKYPAGFSNSNDNTPFCLLSTNDNALWSGMNGGLIKYGNGVESKFQKSNSALPYLEVIDLEQDKYGKIWIVTVLGGLSVFNPNWTVSVNDKFADDISDYSNHSIVYPNPVNQHLYFNQKSKINVNILTANAISIMNGIISPSEPIDVSSLNPGIYIARIINEKGHTIHVKFIKQ